MAAEEAEQPRCGSESRTGVRGDGPLPVLAMTQDAGLPERSRPGDLTWVPDAAGISFASRVHTV